MGLRQTQATNNTTTKTTHETLHRWGGIIPYKNPNPARPRFLFVVARRVVVPFCFMVLGLPFAVAFPHCFYCGVKALSAGDWVAKFLWVFGVEWAE